MKARTVIVAAMMLLGAASSVPAATHYVDLNSMNPSPPYTNWATAASVIQDAVDAAAAGEEILVTNGLYSTGGRAARNVLVNRVVVDKPLTVRSVNGPQFTVIQGYQFPVTTNGASSIRCAYLSEGAGLSGFTLSNGIARDNLAGLGGGVFCVSSSTWLSNCVITGSSADSGGGAYGGTISNCTLTNNSAYSGGGAAQSILNNCTLISNRASREGGGAYWSTMTGCLLISNMVNGTGFEGGGGGGFAGGAAALSELDHCQLLGNSVYGFDIFDGGGYPSGKGGGAAGSVLNNCSLTGNEANYIGGGVVADSYDVVSVLSNCVLTGNSAFVAGGGTAGDAVPCTLIGCTLVGNSANQSGGGAIDCTLYNCLLTGNSADVGGGASGWDLDASTLYNCSVVGNLAQAEGGGVSFSWLENSIVAYNAAWTDANFSGCTLDHCCTTPLPPDGQGNIAVPPLFQDFTGGNLRLQSNSPCINAGNNSGVMAYDPALGLLTNRFDLDGNPRTASGTVDIGAYEYQGTGSVISYAWLQEYGLSTDGSADFLDPDHDAMSNWQEWVAGTNPTNALSGLRILSSAVTTTNVTITWQSVPGVVYSLERSTNLWASPSFLPLATGISGQPGSTSYTDAAAVGLGPFYYRVAIQR